MRQFSPCCLLAVAAVSMLAVPIGYAHAQSVKDTFEKYGLIGSWAWDCSKPPSNNDHYFINRVIDAAHIQRDAMSGPTTRDHVSIFDKATPLGPNELAISGVYDKQPTEAVFRVQSNRQQTTEFTLAGKKQIRAESSSPAGNRRNGRTNANNDARSAICRDRIA